MIHVYPLNDELEHDTDTTMCWCDPFLDTKQQELIVVHHAADCRELIEEAGGICQKNTEL